MQLNLLTPHKTLITNETVEEIYAPGFAGQLDIFDGHTNFVSPLVTGVLKWRKGTQWKTASISYGILEIFNGNVSVMADVSELGEEIDMNRAKAAVEKARTKIDEGGLDDVNFKKYDLKLKRAMSRVSAAGG